MENIHPQPELEFQIDLEELEKHDVVATWHTHPNSTSNLSVDDYRCFFSYDSLQHYIIGSDNVVSRYYVENDILLRDDDNEDVDFTRVLEGTDT